MKKNVSLLLAALMIVPLILTGCKPGTDVTTDGTDTAASTDNTATEAVTEPQETEEIIVDEEPIFYEKQQRDPVDPAGVEVSGTDWTSTINTANAFADHVQGRFTDAARRGFVIENDAATILYDLASDNAKRVKGIYSKTGVPYFEDTADAYLIDADGNEHSTALSGSRGRMNSHRLGYYYYDFRFCDQDFVSVASKQQSDGDEPNYDILAKSGSWGSHDTTKPKKIDGVLTYTVKDQNDPYITTPVNFSTEKFDTVQITLKTESAANGNIYIIAGSQQGYSAEQHTDFSFTSGGDWVTCVIPLSLITDYTGTVRGFRLDCGATAGEVIEIKEIRAVKRGGSSMAFKLERVFHTYPDKIHEVVRAVSLYGYEDGGTLLTRTVIPAENVRKFVLKNAQGEVSELEGFDFSTTEYVGFDIKGAGVFGMIMPDIKDNGEIKVELIDGNYVITRSKTFAGKIKEKGDVYFGHRIYTSESHQFNDLRKEAFIERNPLEDVYIYSKVDNARALGYQPLTGCYRFTVKESNFNLAYYREPDKQYKINAFISGDGVVDRTIYIQGTETGGMLESAALLDEKGSLLPIPIEVGKNFKGEYEEKIFDPDDTAYGESYFPITVGADEVKKFTLLHLYQNWGNFPLKQLSFIAFHICYYHLSVGVTETNCIAPYFVYGKDGWTLPDFRANSAPLWANQPQHTSAGRLYFLQYTDADGKKCKSESQSADIASAGPVYADINMDYLSDDGKIRASYRHAEMPQTDETRTYYTIRLEVNEDVTFNDFKNDFSFFTFDGRGVFYSKVGYLDKDNKSVIENVSKGSRIITLGGDHPYYEYFGGNEANSVNFALIVLDSDITVGGKKYDGSFIFRDSTDDTLNTGSLSLDLGKTTLKKGDVLQLNIILLPWGYSTSKDDSNVLSVRQDTCFDPYKLTPVIGTVVEDNFIPSVRAENGTAVFKLSGGRNNAVVRVYGFEKYDRPTVTFKADGVDTGIKLEGKNKYDGYQVYRDPDGTYSFSFAVDMDAHSEYEITVTQ